MTAFDKFNEWLAKVPVDSAMYQELKSIESNEEEIESRFLGDLEFGTAGLRGVMGAGSDRMNIYTVRRAALAYGTYIRNSDLPDTCAIAYDTRNNSLLFSQTCAVALAELGIKVYLFSEAVPTPVLSFAVRHLKTGGGVVMTASHNPSEYNGMKCYGDDGCQQTDDPAAAVYAIMQECPVISEPSVSIDQYIAEGKIVIIYDEVMVPYYEAVLAQAICVDEIKDSGLKILYTPLHGTGLRPVTTIYDRLGVDYDVITAQATPDGDFPTCPYPNPETPEAFNEALKAVTAAGAPKYDLIVATDPDADRMAVAVPVNGEIIRISGNELGSIMLDFILENSKSAGTLPADCVSIKSIVTTPMAAAVAEKYGCRNIDVLTGFKYIGSTILDYEKRGEENKVIFAFEESCGFLKGSYVRDKDAQIACTLVAALAAVCKKQGISILDRLEQLFRTYGYYRNKVLSISLNGEKGKQLCAQYIDSLRSAPLDEIAGIKASSLTDYKTGIRTDFATGAQVHLNFPSSNVLAFELGTSGTMILRPSGTEPKLKVYCFAVGETAEGAEATLAQIVADMEKKLHDFGVI